MVGAIDAIDTIGSGMSLVVMDTPAKSAVQFKVVMLIPIVSASNCVDWSQVS